jgi:7,8-dihydropterin-6-yl-methyl-4-(beta-D-ribofuranosyl)aminobenzene 5'-phosphate synthase
VQTDGAVKAILPGTDQTIFGMIKQLTITQLVENTAGGHRLLAEHGASFHIDADGHHLLFDTGQGLTIKNNVQQLAIPMTLVEDVILSHGHYDHSGGLMEVLELTGSVNLYHHPKAFEAKFNRKGREVGSPINDVRQLTPLVKKVINTRSCTEVLPGIHVTGEIPRKHPIEDTGDLFYQDEARSQRDELMDDQALYIETTAGLVVLLGCGHAGVINTLEYIQELTNAKLLHALIGGMHLLHTSQERLAFTAEKLQRMGIDYLAPNHCTGLEAVCYFKHRFPQSFQESRVGDIHKFG